MRRLTATLALALLFGGCGGSDRPAGQIEGPRRSDDSVAAWRTRQLRTSAHLAGRGAEPIARPDKQILFGDLHVHTTYSLDAFTLELPFMGLQGAHPPADACDFARHCANLDFFSLNDHAESLTPEHWAETKDVIRQCNQSAGDGSDQDVIAFTGWEWTQVGATPETHWGHKNVIFRDLADDALPVRPISSRPDGGGMGIFDNVRLAVKARWIDPLHWRPYADLAWLLDRVDAIPTCPKDVPVRVLPADCHENAPTPADLYAKLDAWGFPALVIPHGNAWGMYTPPLASWDKALSRTQHDPKRQILLEIMSGHGNSEEFRSFAPLASIDGEPVCPEPDDDFLPCCWQAGEIMRSRCGDLPDQECEARVVEARRLAARAEAMPTRVFPDASPEEWLDCDQCRDCFKPAFGYRPRESSQYALALSDFADADAAERPLRFRFGFIASTDDHTARPGTGYKQYARRMMTFASGVRAPRFAFGREMEDPSRPAEVDVSFLVPDGERVSSFSYPGGIVAVHAASRTREAVWDALQSREVYGTSGPRMLLWFDLLNGPGGRAPMGSHVSLDEAPRFEVRASGAFVQLPGCPAESERALSPERLMALCAGECVHPGDERRRIDAIEVVRIRPQATPGEPLAPLIEDPWQRLECPPDPAGCVVEFADEDFLSGARDALYYVRAVQEETPAINGAGLRTRLTSEGEAVAVSPCYGDYRTDLDDDCLAPVRERAWSSPIFVDFAGSPSSPRSPRVSPNRVAALEVRTDHERSDPSAR